MFFISRELGIPEKIDTGNGNSREWEFLRFDYQNRDSRCEIRLSNTIYAFTTKCIFIWNLWGKGRCGEYSLAFARMVVEDQQFAYINNKMFGEGENIRDGIKRRTYSE